MRPIAEGSAPTLLRTCRSQSGRTRSKWPPLRPRDPGAPEAHGRRFFTGRRSAAPLSGHPSPRTVAFDGRSSGSLARNTSRLDEGVQGRPLQPDVLAELHVRDPPLGDQSTDEAFSCPEVLAGLFDRQQLVLRVMVRSAPRLVRRCHRAPRASLLAPGRLLGSFRVRRPMCPCSSAGRRSGRTRGVMPLTSEGL